MHDATRAGDRDDPSAAWPPVDRTNLSQVIAESLIERILSGEFKFGEKLPAERVLTQYLGVGRPTLREAIRSLSLLGLLEVRQGEGTFVVDRHSEFVAKAFGWAMLLDAAAARDVVETRLAIETELARLAADRATEQDLRTLDSLLAAMEASLDDPQAFIDADLGFHTVLARSAQNLSLERLFDATHTLLRRWIALVIEDNVVMRRAADEHRRILDEVRRHDPDAAAAAMRAHIEDVGGAMLERVADLTTRLRRD